jgi:hypothetical protein
MSTFPGRDTVRAIAIRGTRHAIAVSATLRRAAARLVAGGAARAAAEWRTR